MMKSSQDKKHFVYIVRCADDSLYTGYTISLDKRLAEHNGAGETKSERAVGSKYTRVRRPVKLVYSESFPSRSEAMQREFAIKKLTKLQKESMVAKGIRSKRKVS